MADWNPDLYRRFEDERTRPAAELLARVPLDRALRVVDVGCGPGNSTELLARRFGPEAVSGFDTSDAMLEDARKRLPGTRFFRADAATWAPETPPDLIYSNAALQWVPDHRTLIPHLFGLLAPGGVLAVQMPDNLAEPSHRAMRDTAADGPWSHLNGEAAKARADRMLSLEAYYDLLAPRAASVDVWRTAYQHPMDSASAIVSWVRATGLRPFVDPLPEDLQAAYLAAYETRIAAAYPARADGKRLLAFPRLFIVARKAG